MPGKQAKVVSPLMLKRMLRKVSQSAYPAKAALRRYGKVRVCPAPR